MNQITTLPNGLRVATAEMSHMESVSVGLWVGVVGRHEPKRISGISHFIEHLLFKGTKRRSAKQISQTVEGVGGYLNAFTSEENTCYYAKSSYRHFDLVFDVLSDMYRHSRMDSGDITKERQVIKEELLTYRDQPDYCVHEMLIESLWPNHALGRTLTGTPETLDAMNRRAILDYKSTKYLPANTVVAVAGHCRHDDIVERVRRALPATTAGKSPSFTPVNPLSRGPQLRFVSKDVEQTHLALAVRGYSRHDSRRYAMKLMSLILGENMSSRLFQVIREEHGLAYSIQSSTSYFADTGAFLVSAGLDTKRLPKALKLILRELAKFARQGPAAEELQRAKDYSVGQMRLGLESSSNQMMWIGEHLLAYGTITSPDEVERKIVAVTAEQIRRAAADLLRTNRLCVSVITPSKDECGIAGLLKL